LGDQASTVVDADARQTADAIRNGDRRAMARAITRLESTRDEDREVGQAVLEALITDSGDAIRVGIRENGLPSLPSIRVAR
jgi:LAO/AO transport system kinase